MYPRTLGFWNGSLIFGSALVLAVDWVGVVCVWDQPPAVASMARAVLTTRAMGIRWMSRRCMEKLRLEDSLVPSAVPYACYRTYLLLQSSTPKPRMRLGPGGVGLTVGAIMSMMFLMSVMHLVSEFRGEEAG